MAFLVEQRKSTYSSRVRHLAANLGRLSHKCTLTDFVWCWQSCWRTKLSRASDTFCAVALVPRLSPVALICVAEAWMRSSYPPPRYTPKTHSVNNDYGICLYGFTLVLVQFSAFCRSDPAGSMQVYLSLPNAASHSTMLLLSNYDLKNKARRHMHMSTYLYATTCAQQHSLSLCGVMCVYHHCACTVFYFNETWKLRTFAKI